MGARVDLQPVRWEVDPWVAVELRDRGGLVSRTAENLCARALGTQAGAEGMAFMVLMTARAPCERTRPRLTHEAEQQVRRDENCPRQRDDDHSSENERDEEQERSGQDQAQRQPGAKYEDGGRPRDGDREVEREDLVERLGER